MAIGYIYLLVDDASAENTFKVGMTTRDPSRRLREYKGLPRFLEVYLCSDCIEAERNLIEEMKKNFDVYKGREHFRGNRESAHLLFGRVCRLTPCPMDTD